jgi:predicted anti-sigma-YlaC factor YlaD
MSSVRRPPAAVVTAVILTVLLALLFGGVVAVFGFVGQEQDLAIGGLVIGTLLLVLAWRLRRGGRGARLAGIAVGAAVVVAGLFQSQGVVARSVFALLGLALIVALTVPARAREYFRARPTLR